MTWCVKCGCAVGEREHRKPGPLVPIQDGSCACECKEFTDVNPNKPFVRIKLVSPSDPLLGMIPFIGTGKTREPWSTAFEFILLPNGKAAVIGIHRPTERIEGSGAVCQRGPK